MSISQWNVFVISKYQFYLFYNLYKNDRVFKCFYRSIPMVLSHCRRLVFFFFFFLFVIATRCAVSGISFIFGIYGNLIHLAIIVGSVGLVQGGQGCLHLLHLACQTLDVRNSGHFSPADRQQETGEEPQHTHWLSNTAL